MRYLNPPDLPQPTGPYSQATLSQGPGEWLYISGQVGTDLNRETPAGFEAQAELAWGGVERALAAAGMGWEHVVKTTVFLVDRADAPLLRPIRERYLGTNRPASTLVLVQGLLNPDWKIEVEAVAFHSGK